MPRTRWVGGWIALVALPGGTALWGGCTDDPAAMDDPVDAAAPETSRPPDGSVDAQGAPPEERACSSDLDEDGVWKHLECSGLYASFADRAIAADVKAYRPGLEFWSDGAEKQRWVFLPAAAKIDITSWDEWVFPVGTKVWKEFRLGGKRIETRLFVKQAEGWSHAVYRWNAAETDAVRSDGGEKIPGIGPDGGTYEVPSSAHCDQCHFGRKDRLLGLDAVSLGLPTAEGQTLATLTAEGRLSAAPPATTLDFPGGAQPGVVRPAVGWLHVNCGMCHNKSDEAAAAFTRIHFRAEASQLARPDGGAPAALEELDVYAEGYCKDSSRFEPDAGGAFYKLLRGGAPTRSAVVALSGRRSVPPQEPAPSVQMPPIVTRAVDHAGQALLHAWINTLPPCP